MLSKAEKFFIEQHRHLSAKEIAAELGLKTRPVATYLKTLPPVESPTPEATPRETPLWDSQRQVAIMTPGHSALNNVPQPAPGAGRLEKNIHRY